MTATAPGGVHHVAIAVRDLGALEAFYTSVLGLPILRRWPAAQSSTVAASAGAASNSAASDSAVGDRAVWLDLGNGAFLALERAAEPAVGASSDRTADPVLGYLMIALRIASAARADWEARLAAAGVTVVHRTAYTLYVADPEGNRVGLSHWPDAAAEPGAAAGAALPERRG
jgi:glyoxylase I family protein